MHLRDLIRGPTAVLAFGAVLAVATAQPVSASVLFSNGFEVDAAGWENTVRVPSGSGGITSATGAFHGTRDPNAAANQPTFTRFGGYNYGAGNSVPTAFQEFSTSIDIYLDVGGGWANNTKFDFSSAISNALGDHKRDFIFHAGFYNDGTGPGANTDRFVLNATNNSNIGQKPQDRPGAIAISQTGWYTFETTFNDYLGTLSVDLSIYDDTDALVGSWTRSAVEDTIATVGGSRYGWFVFNEFSTLAFDNSQMQLNEASVPEPASLALLGLGLVGLLGARARRS